MLSKAAVQIRVLKDNNSSASVSGNLPSFSNLQLFQYVVYAVHIQYVVYALHIQYVVYAVYIQLATMNGAQLKHGCRQYYFVLNTKP